jgi:PAS domain S-box-containing protein
MKNIFNPVISLGSEQHYTFFGNCADDIMESLDAIFISDEKSALLAINEAACELTGYTKEELFKMQIADLYDEPDQEFNKKIFNREKILSKAKILRKDGLRVDAELTSSLISISGTYYIHTIVYDITSRKKAEKELFEFGERYQLLLENSGLGIAFYSVEGKILMFNQQAIVNLGGKAGDYIGKNVTEVFGEEAGQLYIDRFKLTSASENPLKFEDNVNLEGIPGWYISTHTRILDQDGNVDGIQVIADNITERKVNEERIKTSETEYRSLFDNSIMGISQIYPGGYRRINKAYANMYGYPDIETMLTEVTGNITKLFSNPGDRKKVIEILDKEGYMPPSEFELNRRNGEKFWALVSAKHVRDFAGKLLYLQAEHIEITDQKKLQSDLNRSKEMLANLNHHLDEIRENERMKISRDLHDQLGQSLTAIKIDLDMLLKDIPQGSDNVAQKIKKVIGLVTTTSTDVQRISFDLRPPILDDLGLRAALEWYCEEFGQRTGLNTSVVLDDIQTGDINRDLAMYRVLQESLTNIARHSRARNVYVKLYKNMHFIILLIKDDGIGIPDEKVNSSKSLGILGMSERLKQAKGRIKIISLKSGGTIIRIYMPYTHNF